MDFDISIEQENGHFVAQVVGIPHLRAEGADREAATKALVASLRNRMRLGNLIRVSIEPEPVIENKSGPRPVFYDFNPTSFHDTAGIFKDDPSWMEICEEAYRLRREERDREWPQ
jgi:hypothetical protein